MDENRDVTEESELERQAAEAIMRGVSMNDIAINCGTSIKYIEETYSHVTSTMRSKEITKGLGAHTMSEESKRKYLDKVEQL